MRARGEVRTADATFDLLVVAALKGERCPQNWPHGPLRSALTTSLAEEGRIKIEVFAHNWRVVTIMVGPNKGRHTQRPLKRGEPYKVIYGSQRVMANRHMRGLRPYKPAPVTLAKVNLPD